MTSCVFQEEFFLEIKVTDDDQNCWIYVRPKLPAEKEKSAQSESGRECISGGASLSSVLSICHKLAKGIQQTTQQVKLEWPEQPTPSWGEFTTKTKPAKHYHQLSQSNRPVVFEVTAPW